MKDDKFILLIVEKVEEKLHIKEMVQKVQQENKQFLYLEKEIQCCTEIEAID